MANSGASTNGIIKLTMMLELGETSNVSEIKNMSFEEFKQKLQR